ncbi:hypothetical protein Taro_041615 [Colocasia esculenta]|uniref:Uncharacterized protein n=1 Tax=Colocasia esculenta TaxID=4460 RepID=A0A843WLW8_COLES|nr:hypothetical protein [Colocasia esculenta]
MHAIRVDGGPHFVIKQLNNVHTCGGGLSTQKHPRASKRWISSIIAEKIVDTPLYRPKDIKKDIFRDYGVDVPYYQAWWGKEFAQKEVHGDERCSFDGLHAIERSNANSIVDLDVSVEGRFKRFFVSFGANIHGFERGCRPLLFLDGTQVEQKDAISLNREYILHFRGRWVLGHHIVGSLVEGTINCDTYGLIYDHRHLLVVVADAPSRGSVVALIRKSHPREVKVGIQPPHLVEVDVIALLEKSSDLILKFVGVAIFLYRFLSFLDDELREILLCLLMSRDLVILCLLYGLESLLNGLQRFLLGCKGRLEVALPPLCLLFHLQAMGLFGGH